MIAWAILIATICVGTLGIGLCLLIKAISFRYMATRAVGEVVRIHSQWQNVSRSNDSTSWTQRMLVYYPVIAFEDAEGVKFEVRANFGNVCAPGYTVGQRVPILFPQKDPQSMRINSFMSLYWNAACMLFIAAVGAIMLSFWLLYV